MIRLDYRLEIEMVPLPNELEKIETSLAARQITGSEAGELIYRERKKLGPPWQWKSWKNARDKYIGTECASCGADEDVILVLQHTFKHPRLKSYLLASQILHDLLPEIDWRSDLKAKMYEIRDAVIPDMRNCCPICESLSIQYRKGAATWICNSKSKGEYCGHVFVEPARKPALTTAQKKAIRRGKYAAYRKATLTEKHDFKRDALLKWFADMRRYLSLKDTKTLCKRCAYIEDIVEL